MRITFEYLHLTGTFIKLSCLNVTLLISICVSVHFSIILHIRKHVKKATHNMCCKGPWA